MTIIILMIHEYCFITDITLGVMAYDTCDSDTQALDRALEIVKFRNYILSSKTTDYVCADKTQAR